MKGLVLFSIIFIILFVTGCKTQSKALTAEEVGIENMPMFPGCEDELNMNIKERKACSHNKMLAYIDKQLEYPEKARENGIKGNVIVSFYVNEEGALSKAKVVKKIGYECDEEALRIVNNMPNWIPAKYLTGENFGVTLSLAIEFGQQ